MTLVNEDLPFTQPELDENQTREIPLKNTELMKPMRTYSICQTEPTGRFGVFQFTIEKGKVIAIRCFGHLEVEKDFCRDNLLKVLNFEERMGL